MSRTTVIAVRVLLFAAVLVAWEVLPRWGIVNPGLLPPFLDVLEVLARLLAEPSLHQAIA